MAEFTIKQKNRLLKKLKAINITSEKDILNVKLSDLKKINQIEGVGKLTMRDIEIIWQVQEAIEKKELLNFFTETN